jgi:hypothetical protein
MPALNGRGERTVITKTADYTLTRDDVGATITNDGASAPVTFALPPAIPGLWYRFKLKAAQELRIDPSDTETIALPSTGVQGSAGKYIVADAAGEGCEIECVKAGAWEVNSYTGTWTAE